MLKKINRKSFLQRYPEFTQVNYYRNTYVIPEVFGSYILYVESKSATGLSNKVSKELTSLIKNVPFDKLNFLGDTTTPWLHRDHDYPPVKGV